MFSCFHLLKTALSDGFLLRSYSEVTDDMILEWSPDAIV